MVPRRWQPVVAWLTDVVQVLATTVGVLAGILVALFLPIWVLVQLAPVVPLPCFGVPFCALTLGAAGALSVTAGMGFLAWLSRRGYLSLPSAW